MSKINFQKVDKALDEVRPFLQRDGGDIALVSVDRNTATIKWLGYCQSCSKQLMTLNAIKEVIHRHVPEITELLEE